MKLILHIQDEGDPSVGIHSFHEIVTVDISWPESLDDEQLNAIKEFWAGFYDARSCMTDDEYQKSEAEWKAREAELKEDD